jgi:hypothetical protein
MEGNQDVEAYRQPYPWGRGEIPGCSENEHIGGPEICKTEGRARSYRVKAELMSENRLKRSATSAGWE